MSKGRGGGGARRVSLGVVLGQMLPAVLCFGLLAGVGVLHVASRSRVVDAAYSLSSLESQNRALQLENDRMKLELATLKRPARLEALARAQLGMVPPDAAALDALAIRPALAPAHARGRPVAAPPRVSSAPVALHTSVTPGRTPVSIARAPEGRRSLPGRLPTP